MHLSRDLVLLDILMIVKIKKRNMCLIKYWSPSAKSTCNFKKINIYIYNNNKKKIKKKKREKNVRKKRAKKN